MSLNKRFFHRLGKLTGLLPYPAHAFLWRCGRLMKPQPLARLAGITHAGVRATMILGGDSQPRNFVAEKFFAAEPERTGLGRVPLWMLPRRLRALRGSANLTVAVVDRLAAGLMARDEYLVTGELVRTVVDSAPSVRALAAGNPSLRHDVQRVRREGFGCVISRDPADLGLFYRDMLRPHIEARYGDSGIIPELAEMRHAFVRGALLWIVRGNEKVAGAVVLFRKDRLMFWGGIGVARGDATLLKRGATAAVYIHVIEYAARLGLAAVDFGGSRPWLDDGVLRYKMKWRPRLDPRWVTPNAVLLRWPDGDPSVAAMFGRQALICRQGGGFAFVGAGASWPPATVPARPGEWSSANALDPGPA